MNIPILDLSTEIATHWDELSNAVLGVLKSGQFILGENVRKFEEEAAQHLGAKHAIGVASGTDALLIALRAFGVKPGDEVITTPFTFFATVETIGLLGATPIFADIDPVTFNIDVKQVERLITPKTKAIVPVHLFGLAAELAPLMEIAKRHNLPVLEDTAQAFGGDYRGKKLGAIGTAGAFSFFPSKNLGAFGDGGLLTTNDDAVATEARMLRVHGSRQRYYHEKLGYASRLDEMQASVLRVKLRYLESSNEKRRAAAQRYREILSDVRGLTVPEETPGSRHVYHQYTVRIEGRRDEVNKTLAGQGITTMIYYPVPMHKMGIFAANQPLPETERAASEVLSLPFWSDISPDIQLRVADALRKALR